MLHPIVKRLGAIALIACAGCPGNLGDPGRFSTDGSAGNCPDVPQSVFLQSCATASCHSTAAKQQGLDLQAADVASRLVGVPSTEGPGLLIDPANPAASVLYTKLTAGPAFGVRMPFGEPPLDEATIGCVLQWVTEQVDGGAADSASPDDASPSDDAVAAGETSVGDEQAIDDDSSPDDASLARDASAAVHDAGSPRDAQSMHARDASSATDAGPSGDAGRD